MLYEPDKWILIRIRQSEEYYKILAGWSGGYLSGDSWKLNSGIERVEEFDNYYDVYGYSGSVYKCTKTSYGVNNMTASVLSSFEKHAEENSFELQVYNNEEAFDIFSKWLSR